MRTAVCLLLLACAGCPRSGDAPADASAPVRTSAIPTAAPNAGGGPIPTATTPSLFGGDPCARDADCHGGEVCFQEEPGCAATDVTGRCHPQGWSHECAVNVPMCSCDGRTIWGQNCLGVTHERWRKQGKCP